MNVTGQRSLWFRQRPWPASGVVDLISCKNPSKIGLDRNAALLYLTIELNKDVHRPPERNAFRTG
jgi:hypothetical protein